MHDYPYTYAHAHVYTALNTHINKKALYSILGAIFQYYNLNIILCLLDY